MSNADSSVVDKRIMEFEFHNDQFEAGVRQSMQTLERLKQSTSNAMQTIGNVGSGLKNLFSGFRSHTVADNVDQISKRFSTMGLIGTTVLTTLTQKAVNFGLSLGKKVLSPLTSIFGIIKNKGWARASGVKQAEFMISNLGLEWAKAKDDISYAVNDTRFGFDEAATAAAQLATSGIKFGEDMQHVLKAIGNAASMANVEYSDMAHLFTTMASNGRVYGMQLQQMSIRGINATKALADYLGKTEAEVKELVSKGKVSFNDFVEAINQTFGEAAFKANETFSGVLANNKAVFARIGQEYASGFMDAAKVIMQHTLPQLKKLEAAIKPIGQVASKAMMLVANMLTPIIDNINFGPIKDFIDKYVVPIGDYIDGISNQIKNVQEVTESAAMSAEELLDMANKVIRGDYGNGEARRDKLEELGYSYELIQNKVNELLGCSFRYEVAEGKMAESTSDASQTLNEQASAMEALDKKFVIIDNLRKFISGLGDFANMGKYVGKTIYDEIITRAIGLIPSALGLIAQKLGKFGSFIGRVSRWIVDFDYWGKIIRNLIEWVDIGVKVFKAFTTPVKNFIDEIITSEAAGNVLADIVKLFERFINAITSTGSAVKKAYGEFKALSGIQRLSEKLGKVLSWLREKVLGVVIGSFEKLHDILGKEPEDKGLMKFFKEDGFVNKFANGIADAIEFIETVVDNFSTIFGNKVAKVQALFGKFIGFIETRFPKIGSVFHSVTDKFKEFFGFGQQVQGNAFGGVVAFLQELFDKIRNLEGVQKLTKALSDLASTIKEKLLDGLQKLLEYIDKTFGTKLAGNGDEFINMFGEGGVVDTASEIIGRLVDGLSNVPGAIEKFFTGLQNVPDWLSSKGELGAGVVEFFSSMRNEMSKGLPNFFSFITKNIMKSLGGATASLAKEGLMGLFGEKLGDGVESVVDRLIKFVGWLVKGDKAIKAFKTSAEGSGGFDTLVESLKELGRLASPVAKDLFDRLAKAKDWGIWDALEMLKAYGLAKILIKTGSAIGQFGKIFKNTAKVVAGFKGLGKHVAGFVDAVKSPFTNLGSAFATLGESFGKLGDVFTSADAAVKNWGDVNKVFKEWRKKPLTTALRDFAIAVALVAGSIALLGSDLVNYDKIRANKDILLGFAGVLGAFTLAFAIMPVEKIDAMSKTFLGMSVALLAITAAIAVFGKMDRNQLVQGGIAVGLLMLSLAGAAKLASGTSSMATFGFLAMALAINILIPAVRTLADTPWPIILKGGLAVVALMVSMAFAAMLAGKSGGMATFGFLAMALAINLLIPAIHAFNKMPRSMLESSGKIIVAFMISMALAARIAGNSGGLAMLGFLAISLAINLLIPALLIFSKLPWPTILKGGGVIAAFMLIMGVAIRIASKNGGKGALAFLAMAVAINLIVPALILLSLLNMSKVLGAAVSLGLIMLAIGKSVEMASRNKGAIPAAIAMAAAVYLVGIALVELAGFPLAKILAASLSLALVFATLALAFGSMSKLDWKQQLSSAVAMVAVVAVVGLVIGGLANLQNVDFVVGIALSLSALVLAMSAALRLLSKVDPGSAIKAGLALDAFLVLVGAFVAVGAAITDFFAKQGHDVVGMFNQFGLVIHGFFAGLFKGEDITKQASDVEEAGSSLSGFADNITRFLDMLDETDETKAQNAKNLADAIWSLTKAELVQSISNFLGLSADIGKFGDTMVAYGEAFYAFVDLVDANGEIGGDKMEAMMQATKDWMDIANSLEPNSGLIPAVAGIKDMGKFGDQMKTFGAGFFAFNTYVKTMGDIDSGKITDLKEATVPMIGLAKTLEPNSGLIPDFVGIKDIGLFGTQLKSFAEGFKSFYTTVVGMGDLSGAADKVQPLADAVKPMAEIAGVLVESGGVWQKLFGEKDLGDFGSKLATFAENIVSFCETTNSDVISPTRLTAIGNALTKIATLDGNANDAYAYLSAFSEAFGRLGASIGTFGENSKSFNPEDLENALSAFQKLRDFITSLTGFESTDIDKFLNAFKDLGKTSVKKLTEGFSEDSSVASVSVSVRTLLDTVADKVQTYNGEKFKSAGKASNSKYGEGFSFSASVLTGTVNRTIGLAVTAATKCADKFKLPGQSAASGYASGVDKDAYKSKNSVDTMARNALAQLNGVYSDFYDKGKRAAEGFADGIEDEGQRAVDKAWDMANEAARALASALDEHSPSKRTRQMGVYFVEGFANGIESSYKTSEDAVNFVTSGTLAAMMVAVSSLAAMIDQELNSEPVIRPVVDTSGVEYGMLRVNSMLGSMPGPVSSMLYNAANTQNQQAALGVSANSDYTDQFNQLIESNGELISAVRENRYAIIDGDEAFNYIDRRLGQAQG